jgi:hypothetical protein
MHYEHHEACIPVSEVNDVMPARDESFRALERHFLEKLHHFEELVSDWQHMRRMSDAPSQSAKSRAVSTALAEARYEQIAKVAEEMTEVLGAIVSQTARRPRRVYTSAQEAPAAGVSF